MKKTSLLFLFYFVSQMAFAQDGVYNLNAPVADEHGNVSVAPLMVSDRFGNSVLASELIMPQTVTSTVACQAGMFNLTFQDLTGQGFNVAGQVGTDRRNVACQVFTDLSNLIEKALSPYPGGATPLVQIEIQESGVISGNSGILGAASTWYLTQGGGIAYGMVWQAINTGIDPWYNWVNTPFGVQPSVFHGYVKINFDLPNKFYTDLNGNTPAIDEYDLYSVMLHEAMHSLGFASLINSNGNSLLTGTSTPGLYSKYDTYLKTGTTPMVISGPTCYDTHFNSASFNQLCNSNFAGVSNTNSPIYTPVTWSTGSSLSHYDNNCPVANSHQYVMYYGSSLASILRTPTQEEVNTLCDLGYKTRTTYGGTVPYNSGVASPYSVATYTACGFAVAGANDFRTFPNQTGATFTIVAGTAKIFGPADFLFNDKNADRYDCIELFIGQGVISNPNIVGFTFTPSLTYSGPVVLRYIPKNNATGKTGNTTFIFINVTAAPLPTCPPSACEMICNGDFEAITDQYVAPLSNYIYNNSFTNSPDLHIDNVLVANGSINSYGSCGPSSPNPLPHDFPQKHKYIGLVSNSVGGLWSREGVYFKLNKPMFVGQTYNISYWALAHANCNSVEFRMYGFTSAPCPPPFLTTPDVAGFTCGSYATTSTPITPAQIITNTAAWQQYSFQYTVPTGNNFNFVMVSSVLPTVGFDQYFYFDDFSITEVNTQPPLTITSTVSNANPCVGDNITYSITVCSPNSIANTSAILLNDLLPSGLNATGGSFSYPQTTLAAGALNAGNSYCVTLTLDALVTGGVSTGVNIDNVVGLVQVANNACLTNQGNSLVTTINVNAKPTPTITGPTALCQGQTVTLDAGAGYSTYQWTGPVAATTQTISANLPGIYTVTVTDGNGCSGSGSLTLLPSLATPVTSHVDESCPGTNDGSATVTVTGGTPPYNYVWSPLGGNGQTASNLGGGTYTVTITDQNNCSVTATVVVGISNAVCCNGPLVINGNSNTFSTGLSGNVRISGTFTVSTTPFNINAGAVLFMEPGATINVLAGNTLNITGATLRACTNLWGSITLAASTSTVNVNSSTLQDATTAITTTAGGIVNIDNSVFDKNQTHVHIENAMTGVYAGHVRRSIFRCSSPLLSPAPVNSFTGNGIEIVNCFDIKIGDESSLAMRNEIRDCTVGIFNRSANVTIVNNNIHTGVNRSIGIYAQNVAGVQPTRIYAGRTASGTSTFSGNVFNRVTIGMIVRDNYNGYIENNRYDAVGSGVVATACANDIQTIGNIFVNFNTGFGVRYINNPNSRRKYVFGNTFSGFSNRAFAIKDEEAVIKDLSHFEARGNQISGTQIGVWVINEVNAVVSGNTVSFTNAPSAGFINKGILMNACVAGYVEGNVVSNNIAGFPAANIYGISFETGSRYYVCSNTVSRFERGLSFNGSMPKTKVKLNSMQQCMNGLVLASNGFIGAQGVLNTAGQFDGHPSDNTWNLNTVDLYSFFSDGSLSPFYVRASAGIYYPSISTNFGANSVAITPSITAYTTAASCANTGGWLVGNGDEDIELIINDELGYPQNPDEARWLAQNEVLNLIENDTLVDTTNVVIENFIGSVETEPIGILSNVEQIIEDALNDTITHETDTLLLDVAFGINNQIVPNELLEEYQQQMNEIYLSTIARGRAVFTPEQEGLIRFVAQLCPYEGGGAIYLARLLLFYIDDELVYVNDACDQTIGWRQGENSANEIKNGTKSFISLHPNPARDVVYVDYEIEKTENAVLSIFDEFGRHLLNFNLNDSGTRLEFKTFKLNSGVYSCKLFKNGNFVEVKRLVLVK